jgi:hypothetical protein
MEKLDRQNAAEVKPIGVTSAASVDPVSQPIITTSDSDQQAKNVEQRQQQQHQQLTVLDEERIQTTFAMPINPADVLCGRGKQSFNHGMYIYPLN